MFYVNVSKPPYLNMFLNNSVGYDSFANLVQILQIWILVNIAAKLKQVWDLNIEKYHLSGMKG